MKTILMPLSFRHALYHIQMYRNGRRNMNWGNSLNRVQNSLKLCLKQRTHYPKTWASFVTPSKKSFVLPRRPKPGVCLPRGRHSTGHTQVVTRGYFAPPFPNSDYPTEFRQSQVPRFSLLRIGCDKREMEENSLCLDDNQTLLGTEKHKKKT